MAEDATAMKEMDFPAGGLSSFYSSAEDVAVTTDLADVVETTTAVASSLS